MLRNMCSTWRIGLGLLDWPRFGCVGADWGHHYDYVGAMQEVSEIGKLCVHALCVCKQAQHVMARRCVHRGATTKPERRRPTPWLVITSPVRVDRRHLGSRLSTHTRKIVSATVGRTDGTKIWISVLFMVYVRVCVRIMRCAFVCAPVIVY